MTSARKKTTSPISSRLSAAICHQLISCSGLCQLKCDSADCQSVTICWCWNVTSQRKYSNKGVSGSRTVSGFSLTELLCGLKITVCRRRRSRRRETYPCSLPHFFLQADWEKVLQSPMSYKGEAPWPHVMSWKRLCQWDVTSDSYTSHHAVLGEMTGLRVCDVFLQHIRNLCVAAHLVASEGCYGILCMP